MTNVVSIKDAAIVGPALDDGEGGDGRRGGGGLPPGRWPEGCPVRPLGMSADGKTFVLLDSGHRLVERTENQLARAGQFAIFNYADNFLDQHWPRKKKIIDETTQEEKWINHGVDYDRVQRDIIAECGRRGTIDTAHRVRGTGAWKGADGQLILHCGDQVLVGASYEDPGEFDGIIYPDNPPIPRPSRVYAGGGGKGPAQAVIGLFATWRWQRPELDPHLLLGALCAAKIGGALPWRGMVWVTGGTGTGKSTFFDYYQQLLGAFGYLKATNASAAGIWQNLNFSSLPVIIDEAEPERDPRRMDAMIKLARDAASGGDILRGGDQHKGVSFPIRSAFIFGSIVVPPLAPQDRNRLAILELDELISITPPAVTQAALKVYGEALTRRMIDAWPRLLAVFEQYRQALARHGHRGRTADQYGILLACADLALNDHAGEPQGDYIEHWASQIPADEDSSRDHHECVRWLLTGMPPAHRGGTRKTVNEWVLDALKDDPETREFARAELGRVGLAIERAPAPGEGKTPLLWLYVANSHRGLAELFAGSHWASQSGTSSPWVQVLRRVYGAQWTLPDPRSRAPKPIFRRLAGLNTRVTRLPWPLDVMEGDGGGGIEPPAGPLDVGGGDDGDRGFGER